MPARSINHRGLVGMAVIIALLAVMYAPIAMVFVYSFNASRIGSVWSGFSTRWYGELFSRRELWEALRASALIGAATAIASTVLGALAALGLKKWRARARRAAAGLLALPLVVPDIMLAISLALFYHALGVNRSLATVIAAHVVFGVAYAFVVMASAVKDFDETLTDAAVDAGASPWQTFWKVSVPILSPSLAVAALLVFALSFDDYLITFLTKGVGMDTLPIEIFSRMRRGVRPDTNALFVVLFLFTLAGAWLARSFSRRYENAAS